MKRKSQYANMNASDLARITRERGLKKPKVITLSEWADFLEADDAKREKQAQTVEAADMPDAEIEPEDEDSARETKPKSKPKGR